MHKGNIFVISAPSGTGKSSLVKALCEKDANINLSISHTTRAIRPGETDGINYFFVSRAEFESMIEHNKLLEYAKVYNNYYGTSIEKIEEFLNSGKDILLEIDWQGAQQVKKIFPEANLIFIIPPSLEILSQRLYSRNTDSEETIKTRLSLATEEIQHAYEFDFLVINDVFDQALFEIHAIIQSQRNLIKKMHTQIKHRFFKEN